MTENLCRVLILESIVYVHQSKVAELKFVVVLHITVFQLYQDGDVVYEMRRRKPEPTPLPTQRILNLPHHIDMVWEELAFDNAVS